MIEIMDTPLGKWCITAENGMITALEYLREDAKAEEDKKSGQYGKAGNSRDEYVLCEAKRQLAQYFSGTRREFQLPLNPKGTPFYRRVYEELQKIPYGQTATYGEIAAAVGNPKASRAVGGANHNNPIPIIIPCHRVIGASGALTGYGLGLDIKEYLLKLEREHEDHY